MILKEIYKSIYSICLYIICMIRTRLLQFYYSALVTVNQFSGDSCNSWEFQINLDAESIANLQEGRNITVDPFFDF